MDDNNNPAQDEATTQDQTPEVSDASETSAPAETIQEENTDANPFAALKDSDTETTEETPAEITAQEKAEEKVEGENIEAEAETDDKVLEADGAESETETPEEPTPAEETRAEPAVPANPNARWYVVHTFAGHENKVAAALKQRIEAEHLENLIYDILVPTQDKIEIRSGKKETVKEKIFPGYILIKMELTDLSWLAVRTTQGVTSFIGAGNKPTPISEAEVATIVKFTSQGAQPTFKDVFMVDDTVKIVDGPFAEFIGKVDSVDKEKGRVRVLVSIFGRETPVELDFLQVQKL